MVLQLSRIRDSIRLLPGAQLVRSQDISENKASRNECFQVYNMEMKERDYLIDCVRVYIEGILNKQVLPSISNE